MPFFLGGHVFLHALHKSPFGMAGGAWRPGVGSKKNGCITIMAGFLFFFSFSLLVDSLFLVCCVVLCGLFGCVVCLVVASLLTGKNFYTYWVTLNLYLRLPYTPMKSPENPLNFES